MTMADIMVTSTAQRQIEALDDTEAHAVDSAIETIDQGTGELIDLPGAPAGTSYLALPTKISPGGRAGPVIAYRPRLPAEGSGWLIMSLLSPEKYRALRRTEEIVAAEPGVRQVIGAFVAGTISPIADLTSGTATSASGGIPTLSGDPVPGGQSRSPAE